MHHKQKQSPACRDQHKPQQPCSEYYDNAPSEAVAKARCAIIDSLAHNAVIMLLFQAGEYKHHLHISFGYNILPEVSVSFQSHQSSLYHENNTQSIFSVSVCKRRRSGLALRRSKR